MRGLLTVLWHGAGRRAPRPSSPAAGRWAGCSGPAGGLYHRLGVELCDHGHRHAARQLPPAQRPRRLLPRRRRRRPAGRRQRRRAGRGVRPLLRRRRGRSGGRRPCPQFVAGVVTFATQSAGCEVAGGLAGRPLLLFHGDRDEILPARRLGHRPRRSRGRASWSSSRATATCSRSPATSCGSGCSSGCPRCWRPPVTLSHPAHDPGRAPTDRYEVRVSLASTGRRRSEARRATSG